MVAVIFNFSYFEFISISGRLPLEVIFIRHLCTLWLSPISFRIWVRNNQWLLRYSIFHILRFRSSSIWGHLHLTPLYPLVKSYKHKFQLSKIRPVVTGKLIFKICLIPGIQTNIMNARVAFVSVGNWLVLAGIGFGLQARLGQANWFTPGNHPPI